MFLGVPCPAPGCVSEVEVWRGRPAHHHNNDTVAPFAGDWHVPRGVSVVSSFKASNKPIFSPIDLEVKVGSLASSALLHGEGM
ncbi:hypothetical protein E2C01_008746 [Portunus trituberculatus]|uniref:Uncharacterized protein n=1 Tax=Portunus trituberculatus TaxID=210409 RepID=A0A5B7D3U2_PORTR|nr:hypothetical protein [Portunus trituberculatus]